MDVLFHSFSLPFCYRLNMFPPNLYVEIESLIWWYCRCGLSKVIRSQVWNSHEWNKCPYKKKRPQRDPSTLPPWEDTAKRTVYEPGSKPSPDTESAGNMILDLLISKLWKINFCSCKTLLYGILLSQPDWTKVSCIEITFSSWNVLTRLCSAITLGYFGILFYIQHLVLHWTGD